MIYKDGKELADIHTQGKTISMVYKDGKLLFEAVKSCFGRGAWIDAKPWKNNDGWRDN